MSFLLFCFVSHWRALCWLGLVLESTKHRTQPQYIQENQLSYVKSCGTAFRFFGREKSLIFPFPGISECWPLLHWKLYPTQCKGTPKAHGLRIWTGILQEERGGKESPIPNVVSETDVCVCVCAHMCIQGASLPISEGGIMSHTYSAAFGIRLLERAAHPHQLSTLLSFWWKTGRHYKQLHGLSPLASGIQEFWGSKQILNPYVVGERK